MIHGFITGIEAYDDPQLRIAGPARNAVEMAKWLHGIDPPAPIHLFVAPLPIDDPLLGDEVAIARQKTLHADIDALERAGVTVLRNPIGDTIEKFWTRKLHDVEVGSKLFVFWSGHGVTGSKRSRIFLYGDFDLDSGKPTFHATNFLNWLSTTKFGRFDEKIFLADACGNFLRQSVADEPEAFAANQLIKRDTVAFFASREGDYAMGKDGTGVFTDVVLPVLQNYPGWPDGDNLTKDIEAATAQANVPAFKMAGYGPKGNLPDTPFGMTDPEALDGLFRSLEELLAGVPDAIVVPRYRRTMEALAETKRDRPETLRDMLTTLLTLGDGSAAGLPIKLIEFLLRLEQDAMLADKVPAWLAEHAPGMKRRIDEERDKLTGEGRMLMFLVSASKIAGKDIGGFSAKLCTSDGLEMSHWPERPSDAKSTTPLSWDAFEAEVQAVLAGFLDDNDLLNNIDVQFAISLPLLDRPFHQIACRPGGLPIGRQVPVVLRLRDRVIDPRGRFSKICREELRALRGRALCDLDWVGFTTGRIPRGGGPFLAEFALPHHGGMPTGALMAASPLTALLTTGVAYLFLPHVEPAEKWPEVAGRLRVLLRAVDTLRGFPETILVERGGGDPLALDSSLLWDDPDQNPFYQATSPGTASSRLNEAQA